MSEESRRRDPMATPLQRQTSSSGSTNGSTSYPHPFTQIHPIHTSTTAKIPALSIDANSLALCFNYLLISEKFHCSTICRYWCLISQTRLAWRSTYLYPANPRRFIGFPSYASSRIQTMDFEAVMDECSGRLEREDVELERLAENANENHDPDDPPNLMDKATLALKARYAKEVDDLAKEIESDREEEENMSSSLPTSSISSTSTTSSSSSKNGLLRRDPLWLRMLRHLRRFNKLETFIVTSLKNNDPAQILDALVPAIDSLKEINLAGACHPLRTMASVKEWHQLTQFKHLEGLFLPYTAAVPMMRMLIQHSIPMTDPSASKSHDSSSHSSAQIQLVDEEVAATLASWLQSCSISSAIVTSNSTSSSTSPSTSSSSNMTSPPLTFSLYPSASSDTFRKLTTLSLKFWRPVYLNSRIDEEIESQKVEHILLRQLLSQLPLLKKLKVYGIPDERCLTSITQNRHLSPALTTLILGFHGLFKHAAWRELEQLKVRTPLLETLVLRLAVPNCRTKVDDPEEATAVKEEKLRLGNDDHDQDEDERKSGAESPPPITQRTMNHFLLQSLAHLDSIKHLSLHFIHSVDDANILIVWPLFFSQEELLPLRRMKQLEQLEIEVVTCRTSQYLSRSFNPHALPVLFDPEPIDGTILPESNLNSTLTHLTLFSPCLRDLHALSQLKKLKTLKLISTKADVLLRQPRKHVKTDDPPPPPPPLTTSPVVTFTSTPTITAVSTTTSDVANEDEHKSPSPAEVDAVTDASIEADVAQLEREIAQEEQKQPPSAAAVDGEDSDDVPEEAGDESSDLEEGDTLRSSGDPNDLSSEDDDLDENLPTLPRSHEQQALRRQCRLLKRAIDRATARISGLPPPGPRRLYFGVLSCLESLTLSNFELEREDFKTLSLQPALTHLNMNRCFIGRFRIEDRPSDKPAESVSSSSAVHSLLTNDPKLVETSTCFGLLASAPKLTRFNYGLCEGSPSYGFLPPLSLSSTLTSLTITAWLRVNTMDLIALHSLKNLKTLEFLVCEFREEHMALVLPPFQHELEASLSDEAMIDHPAFASSVSASTRSRAPSPLISIIFIGCGVLTRAEELRQFHPDYQKPTRQSQKPTFRHSSTPELSCAPLYAWDGLTRFLDEAFECGIAVRHKRYY